MTNDCMNILHSAVRCAIRVPMSGAVQRRLFQLRLGPIPSSAGFHRLTHISYLYFTPFSSISPSGAVHPSQSQRSLWVH